MTEPPNEPPSPPVAVPAAAGAGKPGKDGASASVKPPKSRARRILSNVVTLLVALAISGALAEGIFTVLERRMIAQSYRAGEGGLSVRDPRWGWHPGPGDFQ